MNKQTILLTKTNKLTAQKLVKDLETKKNTLAVTDITNLQKPKALINFKNKSTVMHQLNKLKHNMPNFSVVIEHLQAQMLLQQRLNKPFVFEPIILCGDPGVGKSYFVQELAKILLLPVFENSFESSTGGMILTGTSNKWSNGAMGAVARNMAKSEVANFIFFIDEIDKGSTDSRYPTPTNVLHTLWEKDTAKRFKDEFLDFCVDASYINWIAAANYPKDIPPSIRSRANVYDIEKPNKEQMKSIINRIYQKLRAKYKIKSCSSAKLSSAVLKKLVQYAPREMKKRLELAVALAYTEAQIHTNPPCTIEVRLDHFAKMYQDKSTQPTQAPNTQSIWGQDCNYGEYDAPKFIGFIH